MPTKSDTKHRKALVRTQKVLSALYCPWNTCRSDLNRCIHVTTEHSWHVCQCTYISAYTHWSDGETCLQRTQRDITPLHPFPSSSWAQESYRYEEPINRTKCQRHTTTTEQLCTVHFHFCQSCQSVLDSNSPPLSEIWIIPTGHRSNPSYLSLSFPPSVLS